MSLRTAISFESTNTFAASWMPHALAERLIGECIAEYLA